MCRTRAVVFACFLVSLAMAADNDRPKMPANLDFETGKIGETPTGWFVPLSVMKSGFSATLTDKNPRQGKLAVHLVPGKDADASSFGNIMQSFDATAFRGQRVRYKAAVRLDSAPDGGRAQLWFRVDRPNQQMGFFDNMSDRPIKSNDWKEYEIVGDIDNDAESVNIGLMIFGNVKAMMDAGSFAVVGKAGAGNEGPRPLTERGLANVIALTRLLGYVRYFHPSDQAANTKWDLFALAGIKAVEPCQTPAELAGTLNKLFQPIAPTVVVYPTSQAAPEVPSPTPTKKVFAWVHRGVGGAGQQSIYSSKRLNTQSEGFPAPSRNRENWKVPEPMEAYSVELGGGVSCRVPLALFVGDDGTLPRPTGAPTVSALREGFRPNDNDRTTRLAAVTLAWNVWQHFYPYFDVVPTDWNAELPRALNAAASDADGKQFAVTIKRLVAALHDGHGFVSSPSVSFGAFLPVRFDWVEDKLVIAQVAPNVSGVRAGDIVVAIDGRPAKDVMADELRLISGATEQWKRYRALDHLCAGDMGTECALGMQRGGEPPRVVKLKRSESMEGHLQLSDPRPKQGQEIIPGVFYIDLAKLDDPEFLRLLPQLETAKGIIFDLRGYPKGSTAPIGHLTDNTVTCAQWLVPMTCYPDRKHVAFQFSNWNVAPNKPRFTAKVAFLSDGRAISYAETYLAIIEHYRLAEIVGSPTAGTNGNVNPFTMLGGTTVSWTGMKVLKHDGSQHHGVGVQPTVPCRRTIAGIAAGKDEVLEKAIAVVGQ